MRKKLLCTLLTAALLLTLFPSAALADESGMEETAEGVTETVAEEQVAVDPELLEMLPSNDELFSAYVDLTLAGLDTDAPATFGVDNPAGDSLGEGTLEREIYDDLKARIATVAASGGSTEFDISNHFDKFTLQAADFNGSLGTTSDGSLVLNAEVEAAIWERIKFNSGAVMNALLLDCPYELYWFKKSADNDADKRAGMGTLNSYSCSGYANSYINVTPSMKVTFYVVPAYRAGNSDVAVQSEVSKAKTTAQEIVDKNYTSDYARLRGYMEAICNLVSYNDAASKDDWTEGYGNPWQLIWVFDGDESTEVVCEGYAKAFQYLCDLTQSQDKFTNKTIESYIVTGTMAGGTGAGPHMWNVVSIGGKSYLVDVTNCDTGTIGTPDKLFLAGNATEKFDPANDKITIAAVPNLTYQYDTKTVSIWKPNILILENENYVPYTPMASTIKVFREGKELSPNTTGIFEDSIVVGGSAKYSVQVYDQKDNEMTGLEIVWAVTSDLATVNNGVVTLRDSAQVGDKLTLTITAIGPVAMAMAPKSANVEIVVGEREPHTLEINNSEYSMEFGSTLDLKNEVTSSAAEIKYEVTDGAGVVAVSEDGKVTTIGTGNAVITVTAAADASHSELSKTVAIEVTGKSLTSAEVVLSGTTFSYTGDEIKPSVTIDGRTPDAVGCEVAYTLNVKVGTASAIITTGTNSPYTGSKTMLFTITPANITSILTTMPSKEIYANNENNVSLAGLAKELNLPIKATVSYGGGKTEEVDMSWPTPSVTYERKGGVYTFSGRISENSNFNAYSGKLEATITVKPVTVKSVTVNATSTTIKASQIDSYELPTAGTIEYNEIADGSVNVNWPANAKDTLKAAADQLGTTGNTTVTLTAASVGFEDWATVPANFAMPTLKLTITSKDQATVTIDNASSVGGTYGDTITTPVVSGTAGGTTVSVTNCKLSYTGTTNNGASYGPSETAPSEAGTYTVTATYEDDTYYGADSTDFTIRAKEITLTWSGMGTGATELPLKYDTTAKNVTAIIPEGSLLSGDICTVTVTGGNAVNAGNYTAAAVLSNKNYTPTNAAQTYTIGKGDRGVYVSNGTQDLTSGDPKTLNLYPASGLSKELIVSYTNPDSVDPVFEVSDEATAVRLVSSYNNATITAVGNGHAKVTVSFAETDNFESSSVYFYVEALANPVSQISIGRTDTAASLSGNLDGNTIKVVGLGDPKDICVKLLLATDIVGGLTQDPDSDTIIANGGKISVKDGDNLVAEYTVDLSGVTEVPENTTVTEASGTATAPEGASNELKEAAKDLAPTSRGLVGAAKDLILEAAELAKTEGVDKVKIEASLKVEVKSLNTTGTDNTFRLDVKPVYTISTITDGVESEKIEKPIANEQLSSDVTITVSVKLPDNFPTTNVFARHYKNGAVAEILRVRVNSGMATWEQSSFSEIELFSETRHGSIALKMDDGSQETLSIDAASLGMALPTRTKEGYTFKGWKIGETVYTTVTDELLTALGSGNALTAEAQFEKNSEPVTPPDPDTPVTPNPPSSSGGGGGGSSSSVSKKISIGKTSNGTISSSHQNPTKGTKVTLTAKPKSGYVLDSLRVLDAKGNEVELTEAGDGKYTFIMPDGKVTVDAKFVEEGSQSQTKDFPFTDAADSWAKDAIAWAYENGYVNGTSGTTFNPDGSITRQQMWMILARLSGASPANMAEAREWAMDSGVTDGTNGGNAMTRQQMVTFLYRYGRLKGYALVGAEDVEELDGFPDSGTVSGYAQVPLAWAVVNGIVSGTSDGTLNPGGGATRAQFAVILQRFYNNIVEN